MRIARRFCLLLGLVVLSAVPAAAQEVEGVWIFTVTSPYGPDQIQVEFERDGDVVTGEAEHETADGIEISDGKLEGNVLTFVLRVGMEGEWFSVQVRGIIDGEEMTGEASLADVGALPFTAIRASS